MNLRWKKISEKVIRINRYRSIIKKRYRLPNGKVGNFYTRGGQKLTCALVVTKDKKFVVAKQFRPGVERVMWELPGGMVNPKESPRHAIEREVFEETGYRGRIRYIGTSAHDAWSGSWRFHFVMTDAQKIASPKPDETEVIEPVEVTLPELLELIQEGKTTDTETAYRGLVALGKRIK